MAPGLLRLAALTVMISCGSSGSSDRDGGVNNGDCPLGTFRPQGLTVCVIPADNATSFGVSDNRCASGLPAVPPICMGDKGERPYYATSMICAPGYSYSPGACLRGGGSGGFDTGFAGGTGFGGFGGFGGFAGEGGCGGGCGGNFDGSFAGFGGQADAGPISDAMESIDADAATDSTSSQ